MVTMINNSVNLLINKAKLPIRHPQVNDYIGDKSGQKRTKADIYKK